MREKKDENRQKEKQTERKVDIHVLWFGCICDQVKGIVQQSL